MLVFQMTSLLASGVAPKAPASHYLRPALQNLPLGIHSAWAWTKGQEDTMQSHSWYPSALRPTQKRGSPPDPGLPVAPSLLGHSDFTARVW